MILDSKLISLHGTWQVTLKDGTVAEAKVPGSLDENNIGGEDVPQCESRLTRLHTYTGPAIFERRVTLEKPEEERLFLYVERARQLHLAVDGFPVQERTGSLSTPWTYELTNWADGQEHRLQLTTDNSYPGWPAKGIIYSSTATDETQTNWNGLLGDVCLVTEKKNFVDGIRLLMTETSARVAVMVDAAEAYEGTVMVSCAAFAENASVTCKLGPGRTVVSVPVTVRSDAARWDEMDSHLYTLTASLEDGTAASVPCGIRTFGCNSEGKLAINGRAYFLRGEANCCEFPEEGHAPMTVEAWKQVLSRYASYGINTMRFHSHCPPEAAFVAADEIGMLMQPELSHWDPNNAFESEACFRYYRNELTEVILQMGQHPSFVMLSLGNELHASEYGRNRMHDLVALAHQLDETRLFAWGSNNYYGRLGAGECGDFYTSMACKDEHLRATSPNLVGQLNEKAPSTDYTFDTAVDLVRADYSGPVFGFEVGQYEVLPDFDEIGDFKGVSRAVNYEIVRDRVKAHHMDGDWKKWVEATGELSLMCYREEVEAAMRTRRMSGLSLLQLQDFPGQGTALVGMMNAHLEPKPYSFAQPERFAAFCRSVLPLAMLPSRTFANRETVTVPLALGNYGKKTITGPMHWTLKGKGVECAGELPEKECPCGCVTDLGSAVLDLSPWKQAAELELTIQIGYHVNRYPLWVYPDQTVEMPDNVCVTKDVRQALTWLKEGRRVLLAPEATREALPQAITSQFSSDFWSVGNFPQQEGAMGLLIDAEHPIFKEFPTGSTTSWPWWQMAKGRAFFMPERLQPVVRVLDCYKYLRHLALLLECRVGNGRLMLSGMGLDEHMDRVEVRALQKGLLSYMASEAFDPRQEMTEAELLHLFTPIETK